MCKFCVYIQLWLNTIHKKHYSISHASGMLAAYNVDATGIQSPVYEKGKPSDTFTARQTFSSVWSDGCPSDIPTLPGGTLQIHSCRQHSKMPACVCSFPGEVRPFFGFPDELTVESNNIWEEGQDNVFLPSCFLIHTSQSKGFLKNCTVITALDTPGKTLDPPQGSPLQNQHVPAHQAMFTPQHGWLLDSYPMYVSHPLRMLQL